MPRLPDASAISVAAPRRQLSLPQDQSSAILGRAVGTLAGTVQQATDQLHVQNVNMARAKATNALLDHEIAVKSTAEDIQQKIQSGELDYAKAGEAYGEALSKLSTPDIPNADPITLENFNRGVQRLNFGGQQDVTKMADDAKRQDFKSQFAANLDKLGKLAGTPGANIEEINQKAAMFAPFAMSAGIPKDQVEKALQSFRDNSWLNDAKRRILEAKNDLPALGQVANDLSAPDGRYAGKLDPDKAAQLQEAVRKARSDGAANEILSVYAQNIPAGDRALAGLSKLGLDAQSEFEARNKVREGIGLQFSERERENVQALGHLEAEIATNSTSLDTFGRINSLYNQGAIRPSEYESLVSRTAKSFEEAQKKAATAAEIRQLIADKIPLDPRNPTHTKAVDEAFAEDTKGLKVGDPQWQLRATAYATQTRLLPDKALGYIREGVRSPDPTVAANAAQFYSSAKTSADESVSQLDQDSKAMAEQISTMIDAGTSPERAVETVRANVFAPKAVVEQRRHDYSTGQNALKLKNGGAIDSYIDRDFDPSILSRQPDASLRLKTAFDTIAGQYYEKTGDAKTARDLAWRDLTATGVYGPTKVNGVSMIDLAPIEHFGVTREDIDRELSARFTKAPSVDESMKATKPTTLPADEEKKYRTWLERIGMTPQAGFNMSSDFTGRDYDLRGFFKKYGAAEVNVRGGQHFTDEFKLPNHQTFSNQSIYATGPAAALAGHWNGDTYVPPQHLSLPEGSTVSDLLIVPDSLTMRQANDLSSGKPISPSYKIVTKSGDLLTDEHGVPIRYAVPTGEAASARIKDAQDKAVQEARKAVQRARDYRDREQNPDPTIFQNDPTAQFLK